MRKVDLVPHLNTSNIYVRRQIVRSNIARCKNVLHDLETKEACYFDKREVKKQLKSQERLLSLLNESIKAKEQTSLPFSKL